MSAAAALISRTGALRLIEAAGAAALAGAFAGVLVGGLGSRVAMRISGALSDAALVGVAVTNNGNVLGQVTLGGTLGLVLFGGLGPGLLFGAIYGAVRPWLAPLGRGGGLAFGLFLLAALGNLVLEPFNIDFRKFGSAPLNVALFALLFPLFGVTVAWAISRVESGMRDPSRSTGWRVAADVSALFLGLGLALGLVAAVGELTTNINGPDPRAIVPFFVLGVAV